MRDIFAVVLLTASTGKLPEPWAPALIGLILIRSALFYLLDRVGRGKLQLLFGFFAAIALGIEIFEMTGLKSDLGGGPAAAGCCGRNPAAIPGDPDCCQAAPAPLGAGQKAATRSPHRGLIQDVLGDAPN